MPKCVKIDNRTLDHNFMNRDIDIVNNYKKYTCSKAFASAPGTPYQHFGSPLKHKKNNQIVTQDDLTACSVSIQLLT